jgi:putative redox protein
MKAQMIWKENTFLEALNGKNKVFMDASVEHGGQNLAPTPKELLLDAMMGCAAIDVLSLLKKTRQDVKAFAMDIEVEKNKSHPIHFKKTWLSFKLWGDIKEEKLLMAVDKSLSQYCGVNYMISKVSEIYFKVYLNDTLIQESQAKFKEPLD